MALLAVEHGMTIRKREEGMVEARAGPGERIDQVAFRAIGGKASLLMVRICRSLVIGHMAVVTFNSQGAELQQGSRRMAIQAIGCDVGPYQREPAQLVDSGDVLYQP